jgi:tetratricopeptide (TPR) repeat protein
LEAAEQVATAGGEDAGAPPSGLAPNAVLDLLSHLIDKSLVEAVQREQTGEMRYQLLETVRQYAWERLVAAGEAEAMRRRHAQFYLALAEATEPKLLGPEQAAWTSRLDLEHDNLRAALAWARNQPGEAEHGLRLAAALWEFWDVRGHFSEGRRWLEEMLALSEDRTPARAKALRAAGALAWGQADYTVARARMSENLALRREIGEKRDIAIGLRNLAIVTFSQGDYEPARGLLAESLALFRELQDRAGIASALNTLGVVASDLGDFATARGLYDESLALLRELGDGRGIAMVIGNLAVAAERQADYAQAQSLMHESLERFRELGDRRGVAHCLNALAAVAQWTGDFAAARALYAESLGQWRELGNKEGTATCLEGSAGVVAESGAGERAALLLGAAEALREAASSPRWPADEAHYERILARVRAQLGPDRLATAWAEGRKMPLQEALDLAAATPPPAPSLAGERPD